jgi:hypothetical protein
VDPTVAVADGIELDDGRHLHSSAVRRFLRFSSIRLT